MSENSKITWYIDPCGNVTMNEAIVGMLRGLPKINVENQQCEGQICADGKPHSLWKCPDHEFVSRAVRYAKTYKLRFAVFKKEGKNGAIRPWPFGSSQHPSPSFKKHGIRIAALK